MCRPWDVRPTVCEALLWRAGDEVIGMETITPDSTTAVSR